jgi:hypothetical protein
MSNVGTSPPTQPIRALDNYNEFCSVNGLFVSGTGLLKPQTPCGVHHAVSMFQTSAHDMSLIPLLLVRELAVQLELRNPSLLIARDISEFETASTYTTHSTLVPGQTVNTRLCRNSRYPGNCRKRKVQQVWVSCHAT